VALPTIQPLGDQALLVTFGPAIDEPTNQRVEAAAAAVRAARADGGPWSMPIPAYASLLVGYDALRLDHEQARTALAELLTEVPVGAVARPRAPIEIVVRYGADNGPDLEAVAERCGLTPAQLIELHTSVVYRAYMLGFAPGFAYLGILPAELELDRRATPRQRVPAGSVAIAGRQTAVYPLATPGGWHLIGRTDAVLWDVNRSPPALISPGATVRFVAGA
jgi:KipI family sensor histidine kinase inhibitor